MAITFAQDQVVQFDPSGMLKGLDVMARVQLPFITSLAINRSLNPIKAATRAEMERVFVYLAPFTQNSVYSRSSDKRNLVALVGISEFSGKGQGAGQYLQPQAQGGQVYLTRFQQRLVRNGIMPRGHYMLPLHGSAAARTNAQGRIIAAQYTEALYGIKAMEDVRSNPKTDRLTYKTLGRYVYSPAAKPIYRYGKRLAPGIHHVKGRTYTQLFKELKSVPTVAAKFDWPNIGAQAADQILPQQFAKALAEVMGR